MWLSIILLVLSLVLILYCYLKNQELKFLNEQIAWLKDKQSTKLLRSKNSFAQTDLLIAQVNELLAENYELKMQAESGDKNLRQTISNLSHDIRTPLTSLNGYFELYQQSSNEQEQEHYAEIIRQRLKLLEDILESLFTYAKLQENRYPIQLERVNLNELLLSTLFTYYEEFIAKKIEPQIELEQEELYLTSDPLALRRVFINLIRNSLKYGTESFGVKLEKQAEQISLIFWNKFQAPDNLEQENLLSRFYQGDESRQGQGVGLGLAICHDLMELLGGDILIKIEDNYFISELVWPS